MHNHTCMCGGQFRCPAPTTCDLGEDLARFCGRCQRNRWGIMVTRLGPQQRLSPALFDRYVAAGDCTNCRYPLPLQGKCRGCGWWRRATTFVCTRCATNEVTSRDPAQMCAVCLGNNRRCGCNGCGGNFVAVNLERQPLRMPLEPVPAPAVRLR